jgi:hypothetical protein
MIWRSSSRVSGRGAALGGAEGAGGTAHPSANERAARRGAVAADHIKHERDPSETAADRGDGEVVAALGDGHWWVREMVAKVVGEREISEAVGRLDEGEHGKALLGASTDADRTVASDARTALRTISVHLHRPLLSRSMEVSARALDRPVKAAAGRQFVRSPVAPNADSTT